MTTKPLRHCHSNFIELLLSWPSTQKLLPDSVAYRDVHLNGDQEVASSIPARVGTILLWRLIMKSFLHYSYSVPSADSRRIVVCYIN